MTKRRIIQLVILVGMFISLSAFKLSQGEKRDAIELTFVDHIKAGLIEQDVYVEKKVGSGNVYRLTPKEREVYLQSEVYSISEENHHDPFDVGKCGPYTKGQELGFTLSEWLNATGNASYYCEDGWGRLKANFENLLPNATYTMWHFFMSAPPTVPFNGTLDVPLGSREGIQSVFKTDKNGKAKLNLLFEQCLQLSNTQLMSGLAVAYHSDGKTYGASPGPFGKATHVQLFAMLPESYR